MTVKELCDEMLNTGVLGAGRVGKAVRIVADMFNDPEYTKFVTVSGALVPSGLRLVFTQLIKQGYADIFVTNGATVVHDIIEAMGGHHMIGNLDEDDVLLKDKGINRAYDIFMESRIFTELETYVNKILDEIPEEKKLDISIHRLLWEIGSRLEDDESILFNAAEKGIPIFSPGFLDSMLGIPLWMYSKRSNLRINPLKDFEYFAEKVYDTKKAGAIILGGGTPKHHALYMNTLRGGLDSAIQISSARMDDGSLSGAPLKEAISWGKLKGDKTTTIFGDVSIIFPLIISAAIDNIQ
jgi:deoxyhypusine synthase